MEFESVGIVDLVGDHHHGEFLALDQSGGSTENVHIREGSDRCHGLGLEVHSQHLFLEMFF